MIKKYCKLLRVHHYVKNVFVLLPLFFSKELFDFSQTMKCVVAFFAFGLISSVVYIMNDIKDIESDRNHPKKKNRPLASGAISVKAGVVFAVFVFVLGAVCTAYACRDNWLSVIYIGLYFVINVMYSHGLKNYPIVDVSILAAGFLLRVLFGGGIIGVEISDWLYLTVITISFYLALGKRRNEFKSTGGDGSSRKSLELYNYGFLDKMMYVFASLSIVFYSLWCIDPITTQKISGERLIWTVPIVIILFMRYCYVIEGDSDGDPTEVLLHDKFMCCLGGLYALYLLAVMYIF